MCVQLCNSCDVECIDKVTESIAVLNMIAVVFAVTVEDLQFWWKSAHKIRQVDRASFRGWCA